MVILKLYVYVYYIVGTYKIYISRSFINFYKSIIDSYSKKYQGGSEAFYFKIIRLKMHENNKKIFKYAIFSKIN